MSKRDYQYAQDKQRTQYQLTPTSKWKMFHHCWKFQTQNVQIFGYVNQSQMAQIMVQYRRSSRSFWTKSVLSSFGRTILGKAIWEDSYWCMAGRKFQLGMLILTPWKRLILICVCGRCHTVWKETKHQSDLEHSHGRHWLGRTNIILWIMFIWVALNEKAKQAKLLWIITEVCSNPGFLPGVWKNYLKQKLQKSYLLGLTTWKVTQRNVWKDIANLQTNQLNNYTKSQRHAWMIINVKKKEMDLLETCPQYIWSRIGRPDLLWSVNKLARARAVTKWTKTYDKRLARLISYIHLASEYRQPLLCGTHCTTMQIRIFSRLWFCRRPQSQHQEEFCAFSEVEHLCQ